MVTTREALRLWYRGGEPSLADITRSEAWQAWGRLANRWADLRAFTAGYCNHRPYRPGEPDGGGGYADWRCALSRGHPGLHRSANYVWDSSGAVDYSAVPAGRRGPSQPWRRSMVPTRRRERGLRERRRRVAAGRAHGDEVAR